MPGLLRYVGRLIIFMIVTSIPLVVANARAPRGVTTLSGEGVSRVVSNISEVLVNKAEFDKGSGPCSSITPSSCENCQVLAEVDPSLR